MFTVAWWYLLFTLAGIFYGLWVSPLGFAAAIVLCLVQVLHFGIEDKSFLSFSCQVRWVLAALLTLGLIDGWGWLYWVPAVGLTVRLTTNYCLMARLLSLVPWNTKEPFSAELVKRTLLSPPTRGRLPNLS